MAWEDKPLPYHIDEENTSPESIDKHWRLCEKYKPQPSELGYWAENHLHRGPGMTDDEVVEELKQDLRLENLLSFKALAQRLNILVLILISELSSIKRQNLHM